MDRIFRKRLNSRPDVMERPVTPRTAPAAASSGSSTRNGQSVEKAYGSDDHLTPISERAPTINVDIRNSLMMPDFYQRFSVLLPSLSAAPESSVRTLLASQRRKDGPSLTEEEEELLFADLRNNDFVGEPSRLKYDWSAEKPSATSGTETASPLTASSSNPSMLSDSSDPTTVPLTTPSPWPASPPDTSTSFSSFRTFGVHDSTVATKSHGFSGNAALRDADYIRKMKRSASGRVPGGDKEAQVELDSPQNVGRPPSPSVSDRTATPTPSPLPAFVSSRQSLENAAPERAASPLGHPASVLSGSAHPSVLRPVLSTKKRVSLLAGLTPAQVKRISMALGEIEGSLHGASVRPVVDEANDEETLEAAADDQTFAGTHPLQRSKTPEGPPISRFEDEYRQERTIDASPSRLSPSPRSHNLAAHVAPSEPLPPLPQPIFRVADVNGAYPEVVPRPTLTPSKAQRVRHEPSSSISSDHNEPSPVATYIPGQPRPVGSMHRSEGSTSSRAATPTQASPGLRNCSPVLPIGIPVGIPLDGHAPGPIPLRISSLARSQSVSQAVRAQPAGSDPKSGTPHHRTQSLDYDLGRSVPSSRGIHGAAAIIEEEGEEDESETGVTHLKAVKSGSGHQLQSSRPSIGGDEGRWDVDSPSLSTRIVSHQAMVESSSIPVDVYSQLNSHSKSLRHHESTNTLSSDYIETGNDVDWDELVGTTEARPLSVDAVSEDAANETLRKCSGMSRGEMSTLQARLVEKARFERMALRGSDGMSPDLIESPRIGHLHSPSNFVINPNLRSAPIGAVRTARDPPQAISPPSAFPAAFSRDMESATSTVSTDSAFARRASIPPLGPVATRRAQTPSDEIVATPPTAVTGTATRIAPEADPDVRRDFEARIAAATAALNRTPSISASLQRRNTKRNGGLKISSPTLVSSSATLGGVPLVGSPSIDPSMAKALEKASGSGSKMSMRWRKLGFRRDRSITNHPDTLPSPPASARLEDPIKLRAGNMTQAPQQLPVSGFPKSATESESPDLNAFRFPVSEPQALPRAHAAKTVTIGAPLEPPEQHTGGSHLIQLPDQTAQTERARVPHSYASSTDTAMNKFIEAGRAVGLDDLQLNDMLAAKGIPEASSLRKDKAESAPAPVAAAVEPQSTVGKKTARGLFRSLSLKKSRPSVSDKSVETPETVREPMPRDKVVRRTLLVPSEVPLLAPSVLAQKQGSPASSQGQSQRQLSIKRKPLNLTKEDHALVHKSPSDRMRKFSTATTGSTLSVDTPRIEDDAGLGLLRAEDPVYHSTSEDMSESGSLYDIYDDYANQETLASPERPETAARSPDKRSTQAVEITEYADGKLVWSLVDALRARDESEEIAFGSPGGFGVGRHSQSTSFSSRPDNRDSGGEAVGPGPGSYGLTGLTGLTSHTEGLTFRHRERGLGEPRPPTNVYFTSSEDIGDLIDHLSSDLDASRGRIDILPHMVERPSSPEAGLSRGIAAGQFEDAPSPRRPPPNVALRSLGHAEGLPRRQLFAQHPAGSGSDSAAFIAPGVSPSAASFASSGSGIPGRSVEDRLQALLDRLKESGLKDQ